MPAPIIVPMVTDFTSRSLWEEKVWHTIMSYLTTVRKPEEMKSLLEVLISSYERSLFVRRMAAIHRISQKHSYRTIGKELWLTNQTISAIKKALEGKHYRSYNERGKVERKKEVYSPAPKSSEHHNNPPIRTQRTKYGTTKRY